MAATPLWIDLHQRVQRQTAEMVLPIPTEAEVQACIQGLVDAAIERDAATHDLRKGSA